MEGSIFARMGLLTQDDKVALENQLLEISKQILLQKELCNTNKDTLQKGLDDVIQQVSETGNSIKDETSNINNQIAEISTSVKNLEKATLDMSVAIGRIEGKLDSINQQISGSKRHTIEAVQNSYKDMTQEIKKSIMDLGVAISQNRNLLSEQVIEDRRLRGDMEDRITKNILAGIEYVKIIKSDNQELMQEVQRINDTIITKEDFEVVTSFLRLIAANQLVHEAYSTEFDPE